MRGGIIFLYTLLVFFFLNLLVSWFSPAYRAQVGSFVEKVRSEPVQSSIPIGFQEGRSSLSPSIQKASRTPETKPTSGSGTLPSSSVIVLPLSFVSRLSAYEFRPIAKPTRITLVLSRLLPSTHYESAQGVSLTVFGAGYNVVKEKLASSIGELYTTRETTALGVKSIFINPINPDETEIVRLLVSLDGRGVIIETPKDLYYRDIKPILTQKSEQ